MYPRVLCVSQGTVCSIPAYYVNFFSVMYMISRNSVCVYNYYAYFPKSLHLASQDTESGVLIS